MFLASVVNIYSHSNENLEYVSRFPQNLRYNFIGSIKVK